jgi:hypothetical protein
MTDRELMQMALDALEAQFYTDGRTIKALRDRLAQPEPEPVAIGEEWKPCVKLPIVVHVREQRKGETHVSTREGITPVKEDDLIMRGVAGEEYPIGRELFNSTYTFDTAPVHAIDISQERVDETAKRKHDIVGACVTCGAPHGFWLSAPPTDFISPSVVKAISKREWVGLTEEEIYDYADKFLYQHGSNYGIKSFGKAIEAKLKEKNNG